MIKGIKNKDTSTPAWALCPNGIIKEKRLYQACNRYLLSMGFAKLVL